MNRVRKKRTGRFLIVLSLFILSVSLPGLGLESGLREWVSVSGSRIRAKPVLFNSRTRTITIEKADGMKLEVAIDQLSNSDQRFVEGWLKMQKSGAKGDAGDGSKTTSANPSSIIPKDVAERARKRAKVFVEFEGKPKEFGLDVHCYENSFDPESKLAILSRLSPVGKGKQALDRNLIPIFELERKRTDQIASGVTSYLLWWDEAGILPLKSRGNLIEKSEYLQRKLRIRGGADWNDIVKEIYDFLQKNASSFRGVNVTLIEKPTSETLKMVTSGSDMVFTLVTAVKKSGKLEWSNRVSILDAGTATVSFQMWSRSFKAKTAHHPVLFDNGTNRKEVVKLELVPDPANTEIEYISSNGWDLFLCYDLLVVGLLPK